MSRKRIHYTKTAQDDTLSPEDARLFNYAWDTTRKHHGNQIVFYLPGMIKYGNMLGRYPAVSLTGGSCGLLCEHCKGKLLEPMLKVNNPDELLEAALRLARNGAYGLLLTGGADRKGNLPWTEYAEIIRRISKGTSLTITAHTGFPDNESCVAIREAGIKQALIDVMGDTNTARTIYHLESVERVVNSLDCLTNIGIQLAPHIVAGLNYGKIEAEENALKIISRYEPHVLVIVVLTPLKGTPMAKVSSPSPLEVARLIAHARLLMPQTPIALGCERQRSREGWHLENLAIRAGATRIAIWSDHAVKTALELGLKIRFQGTCCSLPFKEAFSIADPEI